MACEAPKIWLILLVLGSFLFFALTFLSGNVSGCLGLKAYSYHVLSDTLSLFVGLLSYLKHNSNEEDSQFTNTYGWVRIELVGSLISHVTITSLCFSCIVDSLQHMVEPDGRLVNHRLMIVAMGGAGVTVHMSVIFYSLIIRCCSRNKGASRPPKTRSSLTCDASTSPSSSNLTKWEAYSSHTPVPSSGFNAFCLPFLHQCCLRNSFSDCSSQNGTPASASFASQGLAPRATTNAELSSVIVTSVSRYKLPSKKHLVVKMQKSSQIDYWAMLLHMGIGLLASILIVIDGLIFYFVEKAWVGYVDPSIGVVVIGIIIANITPLILQSALTLIQHIPENIDITALQKQLLSDIPQIVQTHDLHVWRLEGKKIMATVHIVFEGVKNEQHFTKVARKIKAYFHKWDIHSLTFQPEFKSLPRVDASTESVSGGIPHSDTVLSTDCLYECATPVCVRDTCCGSNAERRLARATNDLPNHFRQRDHFRHRGERTPVTKRSTRDLMKEGTDEEVLEYLILQSEWRRLHRNNRWSSSAGVLTPSTSKQQVNVNSTSGGDIELVMIPDEKGTESERDNEVFETSDTQEEKSEQENRPKQNGHSHNEDLDNVKNNICGHENKKTSNELP